MYKYRTTKHEIDIERREVIKESPKMITYFRASIYGITGELYEYKESKDCDNQKWFDTFKEAKDYLIQRTNTRYKKAKLLMKTERNNYNTLFKLEEEK